MDKTKFCLVMNLLWKIVFCFSPSGVDQFGNLRRLNFGSSCFATGWLIKLLFYTEAGTRTNCSLSRQMVNDGRTNNFNEMQAFFGR